MQDSHRNAQMRELDEVEWETRASSGIPSKKRGFVVRVVPPGTRLTSEEQKQADAYGLPRNHASYLVRTLGPTPLGKGKLYWPRVSGLRLVEVGTGHRLTERALEMVGGALTIGGSPGTHRKGDKVYEALKSIVLMAYAEGLRDGATQPNQSFKALQAIAATKDKPARQQR